MLASGTTNWYFTSPEWTTPKNYLIKSKAEDDAGNVETPSVGNSFLFDTTALFVYKSAYK